MAYNLGIDLGTTFTAAAVSRDGRAQMCALGSKAAVVPSVLLLRDDQTFLVGEAAAHRALSQPGRAAREFKRRMGDTTPIFLGGTPYPADALTARLLRWVVDQVSEREGEPPAGVAVCHPANWGAFKLDLLRQAVTVADLDGAVTLTEPEAAAIHYAARGRVEPGATVAVYDLGGGTCDAAVLRRTGPGWEILGEPYGVELLGGVDVDDAVVEHVRTVAADLFEALDPRDPETEGAMARLRRECVEAKEALSSDTDVTIPVWLPSGQRQVRLTRRELEDMIRPRLTDSVAALRRALRSAGVEPGDVSAVLLVGGSSRIPLVAEIVGSELGRPVVVDAHPKHGVALGAAIYAADHRPRAPSPPTPRTPRARPAAGQPEEDGGSPAPPVPAGPTTPMSAATQPGPAQALHLRLVSDQARDADLTAIVRVEQAPLVLGRSRQADLHVRDGHASARHCALSLAPPGGTLTVEDLRSTNGTFVAGRQVHRTTLHDGDTLQVGESSWRVVLAPLDDGG